MHRRAQLGLGYLPQEASVFRKLSVEDNVMAILETRADLERAAREQRLEQLLEELRIGHVRKTLGHVALRRRTAARRDRAGARRRAPVHAAR